MRWRGAVSIVCLLLAWAALDDITTDNATSFRLEYSLLVIAGLWFAVLGGWLLVNRRTFAGVCSVLSVLLALIAFWSLPHHYAAPSLTNQLGYLPLAWFVGLALWLLTARARQPSLAPQSRISAG